MGIEVNCKPKTVVSNCWTNKEINEFEHRLRNFSINDWWTFEPVIFELSPDGIGEQGFLKVFHQSLENVPASHFWIKGASKMNELVGNCCCIGGDVVSPQGMKY